MKSLAHRILERCQKLNESPVEDDYIRRDGDKILYYDYNFGYLNFRITSLQEDESGELISYAKCADRRFSGYLKITWDSQTPEHIGDLTIADTQYMRIKYVQLLEY